MAFCTQRKFPGQCYEHNGVAKINKMKCYSSIKDHRAWSIDQNQQASYLVDAVHQGEGDTLNSQHTLSNGLLRSRNEIEKISKRVGPCHTIDTNGTKQNDSLKMFELTMELEATKLSNTSLKHEIDELEQRITNIRSSEQYEDESIQNNFQMIENLISERNDLRELLDKFLGVTDQIIELKIQADQMKNIESEYILLQTKFREHQTELETLRSEKESFEERIGNLQSNNEETNSLKETNSKLEKDLYELSSMISVSDNFIHGQEKEIESKLQKITQLNQQIENLKVALSEAEMKLNKKLRLEMDVELMEKELSIMIENSAESNSYNQQVIDRQVEDLATAIKLTLGYMNYELENDEEDNLVEANRQLKTLLLESSNKILEFKDVINKQEQNLMKVTNDFVCKNDELTECLATVEELKTQLAKRPTIKNYSNNDTDLPNEQNTLNSCINDATDEGINNEHEIFENEINLADSQQNSEYESDGREIEDLENIFEKSCGQQANEADGHLTSTAPKLAGANKLGDVHRPSHAIDDFKNQCMSKTVEQGNLSTSNQNLKTDAGSCSADVLSRLSDKIGHMSSYINELESKNKELQVHNIDLLHQVKNISLTDNQNAKSNDPDNERDICEESDAVPQLEVSDVDVEFQNLQLKLDEMNAEIDKLQKANDELKGTIQILQQPIDLKTSVVGELQDSENRAHMAPLEMEKDLKNLKAINEKLLVEISNQKSEKELAKFLQELDGLSPDTKDLISENEELRNANELLLLKINYLEGTDKSSFDLKRKNELENLSEKMIKISELQKTTSATKIISGGEMSEKIISEILNDEDLTKLDSLPNKELITEIRKLQSENCKLQKALEDVSSKSTKLGQTHRDRISTKSEQLNTDINRIENENERIKLDNEKLVVEIGELKDSENQARVNSLEMEKEVERLSSLNKNLLDELNSKMPPDLKNLMLNNEKLRNANEQLLLKANYLENVDQRSLSPTTGSELCEDLLGQIISKFPSNEDLVAEIGKLEQSKQVSNTTIQQMEKDLKKLKSQNEGLLVQLNDKDVEIKQFATTPDIQTIHRQNEELKILNENLLAEISEMKNSENVAQSSVVEMNNELEKLAAVNKTLLEEINELKKLTSNNSKVGSDSLAGDKEKLQRKNEKVKSDNENIVSEMVELKSPDNCSHSSILQMGRDLEKLAALNEGLLAFTESDMDRIPSTLAPDINKLLNKNQELKKANENLSAKIKELQNSENRAHLDANESQNKLETLAAANENLLARIKELEQFSSSDLNRLKNENEKFKSANENLKAQIRLLEQKLQNINNRTEAYLKTSTSTDSKQLSTEKTLMAPRSNEYNIERKELSTEKTRMAPRSNEYSLERKELSTEKTLMASRSNEYNIERKELSTEKTLMAPRSNEYSLEGKQLSTDKTLMAPRSNDYNMEIDWMVSDMKKLQSKNENLKAANEKLLSQISDLQCANRSNLRDSEIRNDSDKLLTMKESDNQLVFASNRNIEIDWMKADMEVLKNKNAKLKTTNESLAAEIGVLKSAETRAHKNTQQMERDLLKLSAMNERLSAQLNDKKQLSKARVHDEDTNDPKDLLKKIDELTSTNERLVLKITELKCMDTVKMRNDIKKLSSTNESLKLQISELQLMSANELKMESNWMATDMKKLLSKNKKLNISNQNLLNENTELRREFKSMENRANMNALQKLKELERLTAVNENLTAQLNYQKNEKKHSKGQQEYGLDGVGPDIKKIQKKNDELKAANEKLLSVILNLKNTEKLATAKAIELEKELNKLQDTNKSLQDTLENYVEKDWNKPKTELERICQLILNDGIGSLADSEFSYMCKWFGKSASTEFEMPKSSRQKNTTRKHCRICHQALDPWDKICDCKQYEEKKRLHLLKEIEQTKLAIQHIQSSNDIEFDLNDVKNRLLKGKPPDQSDIERQYEIQLSQSQESCNVRAHIINKPAKSGNQMRK